MLLLVLSPLRKRLGQPPPVPTELAVLPNF